MLCKSFATITGVFISVVCNSGDFNNLVVLGEIRITCLPE